MYSFGEPRWSRGDGGEGRGGAVYEVVVVVVVVVVVNGSGAMGHQDAELMVEIQVSFTKAQNQSNACGVLVRDRTRSMGGIQKDREE